MNFNLSKRKVVVSKDPEDLVKFNIGDKVVIKGASSASMNLYDKVKSAGVRNVHCPCGIHSTDVLTVIKGFADGYILQSRDTGFITCALPRDLRGVK